MRIVKISSAPTASSIGHLQQAPRLGVHGRVPELLGIHLAEAFVALDGEALFGELVDLLEQVVDVGVDGRVVAVLDRVRRQAERGELLVRLHQLAELVLAEELVVDGVALAAAVGAGGELQHRRLGDLVVHRRALR